MLDFLAMKLIAMQRPVPLQSAIDARARQAEYYLSARQLEQRDDKCFAQGLVTGLIFSGLVSLLYFLLR